MIEEKARGDNNPMKKKRRGSETIEQIVVIAIMVALGLSSMGTIFTSANSTASTVTSGFSTDMNSVMSKAGNSLSSVTGSQTSS